MHTPPSHSPAPPCPICGSAHTGFRHHFLSPPDVETRFAVIRCRDCAHLFTDPAPPPALLDRLYASPDHTTFQTSEVHLAGRRPIDDDRWNWLVPLVPRGFVIDVGCGSGSFLSSRIPAATHRVAGVEPTEELADFVRRRHGIDVAPSLEEAVARGGPADAITLWDVLEHLPDPRARIRELARHLRPGGVLVIGLPNAASLGTRLFGAYWFGWTVPVHLHHYTPPLLRGILLGEGFELIAERFDACRFFFEESWKQMRGDDFSGMGAFQPVPGFGARAIRLFRRLAPGREERLRLAAMARFERRIADAAHAGERDYFIIAARRIAARRPAA